MTRFWPLLPPVFALVLLAAGWWLLSRPGSPAGSGVTVSLPALPSLAAARPDATPAATAPGDITPDSPVTLTDAPSGRFTVVAAGEVLADPRPGADVLGIVEPGAEVTVSGATGDGGWLFVGCETCGEVGGYVEAARIATAVPDAATTAGSGSGASGAPVLGFEDIAGLWCGPESLAFTRADITIVASDGGLRVDGIGEYRFFEDRIRVFGPAPGGGIWVAEFGHFAGDAMVYLRARPADAGAWNPVGRHYRRC